MSEETSDVQKVDNTIPYAVMRAVMYNLLPYAFVPVLRALDETSTEEQVANVDEGLAALLTFVGTVAERHSR